MKKRIQLLFLLMIALTFTAGAQYWEGNQYWANGIHYEATGENTVRVISVTGFSYSGEVIIPRTARINVYAMSTNDYGEMYEHECLVTEIGEGAFRDCSGVTRVVMPNSITAIGKNAFYGCTGLTAITIPGSVTTIGASAFAGCTGLTSIVLPNSVQSMDWSVFYGCTSLASVQLSSNLSVLNGTFQGCTALTSVTVPNGVKALDGTFDGCTALTSVNLPRSVYYIGDRTFNDCSSLSSLRLPNALEYVGEMAFANTGLTAIELPDAITSLGENAFYGSTAMATVSVRAVNPPLMANSDGFSSETYSLANLLVPEFSLATYQAADWWSLFQRISGEAAMNAPYDFEEGGIYYTITGSNTVDVTFRDRNYNSYSGTVSVPASVTHNGVTYSVTGVGNSAFRGCTGLTTVSLPSGITAIGKYAFYGSGLTAVSIPSAVTAIGDSAYCNCSALSNLGELTIPLNVASIGTDAFKGVTVRSLTWNARECYSNGNMTTSSMTQVAIGDEVTVLPPYFAENARLASLDLPNSLIIIGDYAFFNVSLSSLTIPVNVRSIGIEALACRNLQSLTWNARECYSNGNMPTSGITQVAIGDEVAVLPDRFAYNSLISSLSIPASVKYIGIGAFQACQNLTSPVVIPDSVVEIADYAFYGSGVTTMTIGKGVEILGNSAINGVTSITWNAVNCKTMGVFATQEGIKPWTQLTIGDCVERIPNFFAYQAEITSLDLPSSVKEIGDYAFQYCNDLTNVNLSPSLTTIGANAFSCCDALSEVILPGSVKTIKDGAFNSCGSLSFVSIPASVDTVRGFSYCSNLVEASISAMHINEDAFYECYNLTALTLSAPLQSIGSRAFNSCTALTSLHIPNTVTFIDKYNFMGCRSLESITVAEDNPVYDSRDGCNAVVHTASDSLVLTCKNTVMPSGITAIGDYAFYNNTGLTSMDIPETVKSIGIYAFYGCSNLTSINIPDGVETIGSNAFENCTSLTSVRLPSALKALYGLTFARCTSLTSVTIPAATTQIYVSAFSGCTGLESIVVSSDNPVYDSREGCNAIIETASNTLKRGCKGTVIPNTVEIIGNSAFSGCTGLTSVVIPDSVTTIGYSAFYGCSNLSSVSMGKSVNTIDGYAFYDCNALTRVDISDLAGWCGITFSNYYSNPLGYAHHLYLNGNEVTDLVLPDGVTKVKNYTFAGCYGLTSLVINDSVTSIGYQAFQNCTGLSSLTMGKSVKTIDGYAFYGCNALRRVDISDLAGWCGISFSGYYSSPLAFAHHLFLNGEEIINLVLPEGLTRVNSYAFYGASSITSVVIPSTVTYIDYDAFYSCNSLRSVTCLATTPPGVNNYWAFSDYYNSTLRVPRASVDAYKSAYVWQNFRTILGIDTAKVGDVDGNGKVDISDVTTLIDMLLNNDEALRTMGTDGQSDIPDAADVDGDGHVSITDVTTLLDLLLNGD